MKVRRVVTGTVGGRSVFVSDDPVDPVAMPGSGQFAPLWSADEPASFPHNGIDPQGPSFFPALGGARFFIMELAPQDGVATIAEGAELPDDIKHVVESDDPGMHTTDTTDFIVITAGKVALGLDDGAEVVLSPGDTVVQNGARHKWRCVGDTPAVMAVTMVGGHPPSLPD